MGLYLFYFLGLVNILTYIKFKKEIKKNEDLYEQLYSNNKKTEKAQAKSQNIYFRQKNGVTAFHQS